MEALHSAGISNGMITSAAITIILTVIAVVLAAAFRRCLPDSRISQNGQ